MLITAEVVRGSTSSPRTAYRLASYSALPFVLSLSKDGRHGSRLRLRLLALVQHRLELCGCLLEFGCRIGTIDHVGQRDAEGIAELGDRRDHRQSGLGDLR